MNGFVSAREFKKHTRVCTATLRHWADNGKIDSIRTVGGYRMYKIPEKTQLPPRQKGVIYIRVSSTKQTDDLGRQRAYMVDRYPDYEVIEDVGSGINWKRKGL